MTDAQAGQPLVSVVTVCLNSEGHLAEAMQSVLDQSYQHFEYIVVDGGSKDSTLDIVRSFEDRFGTRLKWVSEPDEGIYDAMNTGISMSSGDLVGLLNSDDAYLPEALQQAVRARIDSQAEAVYGDAEIVSETGESVGFERARDLKANERPDWMPMCHQSLFVARTVYGRIGLYDTSFRILADYEFVLRAIRSGVTFHHVEQPFTRFRLGGTCNATTSASNAERERIRVMYGANPVIERARRLRHALNRVVYAVLSRMRLGAPRREPR